MNKSEILKRIEDTFKEELSHVSDGNKGGFLVTLKDFTSFEVVFNE